MEIIPSSRQPSVLPELSWVPRIDLSGKIILAFGGGGNLGETFLYGAAACGATPVVSDFLPADPNSRESARAKIEAVVGGIRSANPKAPTVWYAGDITNYKDVEAVVRAVKEDFGRIDVVVDFAGTAHRPFDFGKDDLAEDAAIFRKVNDINLNGAFYVTATAARVMIPQRYGHIIHLCSSGSRCSLYASYAYNATKHAVEGLVKTAAAQLSPFGIRVNGIAPGTVETDLNRALLRDEAGNPRPRAMSILAHTPSKRFVSREGVAETMLAACVDQRHLTGNILFVDDGYVVEGHSWPEGNRAVYAGGSAVDELYAALEKEYPREG